MSKIMVLVAVVVGEVKVCVCGRGRDDKERLCFVAK